MSPLHRSSLRVTLRRSLPALFSVSSDRAGQRAQRRQPRRRRFFEPLEDRRMLAPVAADDMGATDEDTPLSFVDPGSTTSLFANDSTTPSGGTIALVTADTSSAMGAAVTVNGDGTFTYDPTSSPMIQALDDGDTAGDSFSYTITDATPPDGLFLVTAFQVASGGGSTDDDLNTTTETLGIWDAIDGGATVPGSVTVGSTTYNVAQFESDVEGQILYNGDFDGFTGSLSYATINGDGPGGSGGSITGGDDFSVRAQAYLLFTSGGSYSISAGSDDGRRIELTEASSGSAPGFSGFTARGNQVSGGFTAGDTVIQFDGTTGHNHTTGTFDVAAGDILLLDSFFFERGGGDQFHLAIKAGADTDFQGAADGWQLLTSGAAGIVLESDDPTLFTSPQDTASVAITLTGANDAPVAQPDAFVSGQNTLVSGNVLADNGQGADFDVDSGDSLTVSLVNGSAANLNTQISLSSGALLTVNSDGSFSYDANGVFDDLADGESRSDSFTYVVNDGTVNSNTATVTLTLRGENDPPTANDDPTPPLPGLYTVSESGTLNIAAGDGVLANDSDTDTSNGLGVSAVDDSTTTGVVTLPVDNTFVTGGLQGSYIDLDESADLVGNRTSNSDNLFLSLAPFVSAGASDFVLQRLPLTPTGDAADVITPRIDFGTGTDGTQGDGSVLDRGGFSNSTVPPWQGLFNDLGLTADMDGDQIAATWSGKIEITTAGTYTFTTRSDDGSVLFINGQQVVNNNKSQGMTNRSGSVTLDAGLHDISAGFYEGGGGAGMQVSYSGPDTGNTRVIIPPTVLYNDVATPGTFVSGGLRGNYYDTNNSGSNGGFNFSVDEWLLNATDPADNVPLESLRTNASQFTPRIDFGAGTEVISGDGSVLNRGGTSGNPYGGVGIDLGNDQIGAVWEGILMVPETADFEFTTRSDDHSRVYLDINNDGDFDDAGELVASKNGGGMSNFTNGPVALTAGPVAFKAVTGEGGGGAGMQVSWQQLSGSNTFAREIIPPQAFATLPAGDGSFSYDPDGQFEYLSAGETAIDTFDYTVTDPLGATDTATVSITVVGENDAPVITGVVGDQSAVEGVPLSITDIITFTDIDLNDSHTVTVDWGDLTTSNATVTQDVAGSPPSTPDQLSADATHTYADDGTYTVTVTVDDGTDAVMAMTFDVVVANADPVANDDSAQTDENTPLVVPPGTLNGASLDTSVLDNDTDVPADPLTVVELNGTPFVTSGAGFTALGAAITLNDDGSFTYDPTGSALLQSLGPGESLDDSFTYTISDGDGGTDSATVTITVTGDSTIEVDTNLRFIAPVAPPDVPGGDGTPDAVELDVNGGNLEIRVNGNLLRSTPVLSAPVTVTGSSDADTITVNGLGSGGATLDGAGGSDSYVLNLGDSLAGAIQGTVTIADTGAGDTDAASVTGGTSSDTFDISSSDDSVDQLQRAGGETVNYDDNLEQLTVFGNNEAGQPGDVFNVTPDGATAISIDGDDPLAAPGDQLIFDALGGAVNDTGTSLEAAGRMPVGYTEIEQITLSNAAITVDGTGLNDTLTVTATGSSDGSYVLNTDGVDGPTVSFLNLASLAFNGQAGNDELIIQNPAGGVFAPSGGIDYDGGDDSDALTLSGGSAAVETYSAGPAAHQGQVDTGPQTLNFQNVEGPFTDTVPVQSLTINTVDTASDIRLQNGPLPGLATLDDANLVSLDFSGKSELTVNAGDQDDSLTVDLSDTATGLEVVTMNGGGGQDDFDVFALPDAPAALTSLSLNGDDGNDTFGATTHITPHPVTPIDIDGGLPTVAPGDVLNLDMSGAAPVVIVDTIGGVAISGDTAPVTWASIETLDLIDNSGPIENADVGDLYVRTAGTSERIIFTLWNDGGVKLRVDDRDAGTSTTYPQHFGLLAGVQSLTQLLVYAQDGNDIVSVAAHVVDGNGDAIPVEFHGEEGDDYLAGANANDLLVGGPGNDRLVGGEGDNALFGDGNVFSAGVLVEEATDGNDYLAGRDGNDTLWGGGGNDRLVGSDGSDVLYGGTGDDFLDGGHGTDLLRGEDGDDTLQGSYGDDVLLGGNGDDELYGGADNDILIGGLGADDLRGDSENDLLAAGTADQESATNAALLSLLSDWSNSSIDGLTGNLADASVDILRGDTGDDVFWADILPGVTDQVVSEVGETVQDES